MPDDYSADTRTTGVVAVGGTATGEIEAARDFDWFAVNLIAGRTYVIDIEGDDTGGGTLVNTVLRRLYDADGNRIAGTWNNNGGEGRNARLTFTATETATYFIEARGRWSRTGTYTVRVTDDTDDLGDLTDVFGTSRQTGSLDGADGAVVYWRFTLTAEKSVDLGLREQDANADLILEDIDGNVLHSSRESGTADESLQVTLQAGTYYVRVEAQAAGTNAFELRYEVTVPEPPATTIVYTTEELQAMGLSSADDDYSQATGQAGTVEVGSSATGEIETVDDRDWFAVSFVAGKAYRIKLEGSATDQGTLDDPRLRGIFKADGGDQDNNLIAGTGDNDSGVGLNSEVLYHATETATYYVAAGAHGSSTGTYRLSVAELGDDYVGSTGTTGTVDVGGSVTGDIEYGHDRDWFAVSLVAGTKYSIKLEGSPTGQGTLDDTYIHGIYNEDGELIPDTGNDDSGLGFNSEVVYVATESATYYIAAGGYGSSKGTYRLSVAELGDDYAEGSGTTGTVDVGGSVTGDIEYYHDRDWFAVSLVAGTTYSIKLEGSPTDQGTLDDTYIHGIYNEDGELIPDTGNHDSGVGHNSELVYVATETATHYISAGGYVDPWGGPSKGTYRLSVAATSDDYSAAPDTTATIAVGGTATGELEFDGDRDWFAVTLEAAKTYRIDVKGDTADDHGGTLHNPGLAVYDTSGNPVSHAVDDNSGLYLNARLGTFSPATDGKYFIEVKDPGGVGTYTVAVNLVTAGSGDDFTQGVTGAGTVAVGGSTTGNIETMADHDWFAVTFEAGRAYRISLEGSSTGQGTLSDPYLHGIYKGDGGDMSDNLIRGTGDNDSGQGLNSEVVYEATESATYYVAAGAHGSSTGTYRLSVAGLGDDYAEDTGTTGTVDVGGSVTGDIEHDHDRDWFAVSLVAGTTYRIKLEGSPTDQGTLDDTYIHGIYNEDGELIPDTRNDDSGVDHNSELVYVATESATYYIAAGGYVSSKGTYRLSVAELEDDYADGTGTTGTVDVGGSVTGDIEYYHDRDWFAVSLVAGTTYSIKLEGSPTDQGTLDDTYIHGIYNEDGELIPDTGNDDSGVDHNSELVYVATETATHYISAGGYEGSWGGPSKGTYRLSVSAFPDDFVGGTGTSGVVAVGGTATGMLEHGRDRDWFAVTLDADKTYRIDVKGDTDDDYGGTLHNPSLRVRDSSGNVINLAADDNSGVGLNARLAAFSPDAAGKHFIEVQDPGGVGTYTVAVEEVTDTM